MLPLSLILPLGCEGISGEWFARNVAECSLSDGEGWVILSLLLIFVVLGCDLRIYQTCPGRC